MDTLADLLSSRAKAGIFRLLFGPAIGELHVRELARRAGLNEATLRQELKRLARLGVVVSREDGNRTYYRANNGHPLFTEIRNLVFKTSGLPEVLRSALQHPGIRLAFVFGSLADHTETAGSDVDLLVIGDIGLRPLIRLLSGLSAAVGREINPHVLSEAEIVRRRRAKDHFLTTVLAGPKLFIIGDEHELEAVVG
jgi:DNA-binding transcriptional ArsR family regulator